MTGNQTRVDASWFDCCSFNYKTLPHDTRSICNDPKYDIRFYNVRFLGINRYASLIFWLFIKHEQRWTSSL